MIVALMLLLVMTVLAVSGVGNSVLEQKMSSNYYRSVTAFEAAEYGLRVAEQWLINKVPANAASWEGWFTTDTDLTGLYTTQNLSAPNSVEVCGGSVDCAFDPRDEAHWCMGGADCELPKGYVELGGTMPDGGDPLDKLAMPVPADKQPRFIIEHVGQVDTSPSIQIGVTKLTAPQTGFRITVIGWGQEGIAHHVLQTHVILPL
jgi:type IV pilus assembly protein PilX